MTRPPPLRIQVTANISSRSNSRCAGSFLTRLYLTNWRVFVVAVAVINALRFSLSATSYFQDARIDTSLNLPQLAKISSALGAVYAVACGIETFGVISTSMKRLFLIRVYIFLVFISGLLVTTSGLVNVITYFIFVNDLISECASLATHGHTSFKSTFRGHTWPTVLTAQDAKGECFRAWSNDSVPQIFSIFLFYLIPSTLSFLLVFTYYRQITDPAHPANLCSGSSRTGRSAISLEAYPNAAYSPLYNNPSSPAPLLNVGPLNTREPSVSNNGTVVYPPIRKPQLTQITSYMPSPGPGPPSFSVEADTYNGRLPVYTITGPDDDEFV